LNMEHNWAYVLSSRRAFRLGQVSKVGNYVHALPVITWIANGM
jgi:hypothetical protein